MGCHSPATAVATARAEEVIGAGARSRRVAVRGDEGAATGRTFAVAAASWRCSRDLEDCVCRIAVVGARIRESSACGMRKLTGAESRAFERKVMKLTAVHAHG